MARARIALVAVAVLAVVSVSLFLLGRRPLREVHAPSGRADASGPAAPVLEGRVDTGTDRSERVRSPVAAATEDDDARSVESKHVKASIEGTVTGWNGNPAAGISMFLASADGPAPPRLMGGQWMTIDVVPLARTDEWGAYLIHDVPVDWAGVVVARVTDNHEIRSAPLRTVAGRQRVDFTLTPPAGLHVRAMSATRDLLRLRQVTVRGEFVWYSLRVDAEDPWGVREEEDGSVVIQGVTPGRVTVQAWIAGGPMAEREAQLVAGKTVEVEIAVPSEGFVRGRVLHPPEWRLLRGSVTWDGDKHASGEIGADGWFRLTGTGRGRGRLLVDAFVHPGGPLDAEVRDVLPDGGIVEVRLERKPASVVFGHLIGLEGPETLKGEILSKRMTGSFELVVEEDGRFERPFDSKEPALFVVQREGMAPVLVDLPVMAPGERRDVGALRMGPGVELVGLVRNGENEPVAGVEVMVAERWAPEYRATKVKTDAQGTFRLPHLPERPVLLRFRGGGFPQHLVTVNPGETPRPEIVLRPGGVVELQVVDAEGRGVGGADVAAYPVGEFPYDGDFDTTRRSLRVDAAGKVRTHICSGPRRFQAYAEDGRRSEDVVATFREGETTEVTLVLREKPTR
jgi:hypothetical protein